MCVSAFAGAADASRMHISSPKKDPQKVKRRKWRRKNCTLATAEGRTAVFSHYYPKLLPSAKNVQKAKIFAPILCKSNFVVKKKIH
jgi:hypothetical protein